MASLEHRTNTQHPKRRSGKHIEKDKYDLMKSAILQCLEDKGPTAFTVLMEYVNKTIGEDFHGSTGWYYTSVKHDLETRGIIQCDRTASPQIVKLTGTL